MEIVKGIAADWSCEPTYNLFRRRGEGELLCAVPQDRPVPTFLGSGEWEFLGTLDARESPPPGFSRERAAQSQRYNAFYLFQSMARPSAEASAPERRLAGCGVASMNTPAGSRGLDKRSDVFAAVPVVIGVAMPQAIHGHAERECSGVPDYGAMERQELANDEYPVWNCRPRSSDAHPRSLRLRVDAARDYDVGSSEDSRARSLGPGVLLEAAR